MKEKRLEIPVEELKNRLSPEENIFGIITRTKLAKCSGGLFNRKTMANWDNDSKGFGRKVSRKSGGQVSYFIEDVLEYIRNNYRVVEKKKKEQLRG